MAVDSEGWRDDSGPMVGLRPLRRSMFVGVDMSKNIRCRNILKA
jgi:hypothetical protein